MRLVLIVSILVFVAPTLLVHMVDAACKDNCTGECCKKKSNAEVTEFIYDVTIPWPFRHRGADEDGDGVTDGRDKCPGTPKGAIVDDQGCPTDLDGDGVFDGIDECPGTPRGAIVDERGCPVDLDGDGVFDGIDECPDTPKGARVDKEGCPLDSDGDGVPDGIDRCPNTPRGAAVDQWGCKKGETEFLDTGKFTTSEILFEINKSDIKPQSYPILDEIGRSLVQWPQLRIEIGGYTDSSGSAEFNQKLSERRAQAVLDYLVKKFPEIERSQFTVKGYGENDPIATNDTKEGRAENRRVQFKILNREQLKREKR